MTSAMCGREPMSAHAAWSSARTRSGSRPIGILAATTSDRAATGRRAGRCGAEIPTRLAIPSTTQGVDRDVRARSPGNHSPTGIGVARGWSRTRDAGHGRRRAVIGLPATTRRLGMETRRPQAGVTGAEGYRARRIAAISRAALPRCEIACFSAALHWPSVRPPGRFAVGLEDRVVAEPVGALRRRARSGREQVPRTVVTATSPSGPGSASARTHTYRAPRRSGGSPAGRRGASRCSRASVACSPA